MTEPVTIEERYGNAVEASDLTLRFERTGPVDVLTAAGMAGAKHGLSLSLWRWIYGGDHHERAAVLHGLHKWMRHQANKRRWRGTAALATVTVQVAAWYENRACPACGGTRYELIEGTPTLSDVPCHVCHGSGETSLDKLLLQYGPDWIRRGHDLRCHMDALIGEAANEMLKRMRNVIDEEAGL